MVRCQIRDCKYSKSLRLKPQNGTTFHHFPPDPIRREAWCRFIRLHYDQFFEPTIKQARLCSNHFQDDDFMYTPTGLRYLKKTAIPQISHCRPSSAVPSSASSHRVEKHVDSNVGKRRENIRRENICRACLSVNAREHMFKNGSELAQLYTECTKLKAEPCDGLSQYICSVCRINLKFFSEFRENCISSYNTLKMKREEALEHTSCSDGTSNHNDYSQFPKIEVYVTENAECSDNEYSQSAETLEEFTNEMPILKDSEQDDDQKATSTEKCNTDKMIVKFEPNYQSTYPALSDLENDTKMENDLLKREEALEHTNFSDGTSNQNEYSIPIIEGNVTEDSESPEHKYTQSEGSLEEIIKEISNIKDSEKDDVQRARPTEKGNTDKTMVNFSNIFQSTLPAPTDLENDMKMENCFSGFKETSDMFKPKSPRELNKPKKQPNKQNLKKDNYTRTKKYTLPDMVCPVCKVKFEESVTFEKHLRSHKFNERPIQGMKKTKQPHKQIKKKRVNAKGLRETGDMFKEKSQRELNKVMKQPHKQTNDLKDHNTIPKKYALKNMVCPICKEKFQESATFLKHLRRHRFREETIEEITRMMHSSEQLPRKNVSTKVSELQCRKCNREMADRESLRQHMKISHMRTYRRYIDRSKSGETDICYVCGKTVKSSYYQNHVLCCTNAKQMACKVCGKKFNNQLGMNSHMIRHNEKKFICDYCQKGFRGKAEIKLHLKTHFGWRISCTMCSKAFSSHSALAIHRRIHTGERPYRCDMCEAGFISKRYLTRHKTTHSSERPEQCQYCGNKYKEINSLRRHLKTQCKIKLSM